MIHSSLLLALLSISACGLKGDTGTVHGPSGGGADSGDTGDGGMTDGGSSDAGSSDAGSGDAGSTGDAGTADGGATDGGTGDGGGDGGTGDGGGDGGTGDGGDFPGDGGAGDGGGTGDGGFGGDGGGGDGGGFPGDGGSGDGGSADGGFGDGGGDGGGFPGDGGSADGGFGDGGSADGGFGDGGATTTVSVDCTWRSSGFTLSLTDGDPAGYHFGWAEDLSSVPWTGEDCYEGYTASDGTLYLYCHPMTATGGSLISVSTVSDIVEGSTTIMSDAITLTYYLEEDSTGACWVWGSDPGYYAALGCETLDLACTYM